MSTNITLLTKLICRFRPHASRTRVALAENLAEEINLYPGLPDRLLGLRSCAPARRESELRKVAQRYRTETLTSEAADALCRLTNPALFDCAVPFLRGAERSQESAFQELTRISLPSPQFN